MLAVRRLESVCEISMGQAPDGGAYNDSGDGWPLIAGAGDFGELHPAPKKYTTEASRLSKVGDIILGIRATIGEKVLSDGEYCLGRGVAGLRAKPDLNARYLWQWLSYVRPTLASKGRGATFKQVNKQDIGELEIALPTLSEQRRIAAILDEVDALRAKRREALVLLDELQRGIFIEMFGDPASTTPTFKPVPLVDVALGGFQNGAYFPKEMYSPEGVEMVHMSDAFGGMVQRGELKRVVCGNDEIAKYGLCDSDLLIARRSLTYEGAAKPCRVPSSAQPLLFESSFIRIRPDSTKVTSTYLYHYLNSERVREKFVRPYVTQSTISGINQSNLSRVPVMLPPLELQQRFVKRMRALGELESLHQSSGAELDKLFGSIQERAFRGEL